MAEKYGSGVAAIVRDQLIQDPRTLRWCPYVGGLLDVSMNWRRLRHFRIVMFFSLFILTVQSQLLLGAQFNRVAQWERFEASLTSANSYANPLQEIQVLVDFVSPSGKKQTILACWIGLAYETQIRQRLGGGKDFAKTVHIEHLIVLPRKNAKEASQRKRASQVANEPDITPAQVRE